MSESDAITRRWLLKGSVSGLAALLAGSSWSAVARTTGSRRILRLRNNSRLESLDPAFTINQIESAIICAALPMLIESCPESGKWYALDAECVEKLDETHIGFKLKRDLEWSNGLGRVTAHDVKASFERIANPANNSIYSSDWSALDHVSVESDREGVIVLKEPFAPLFSTTLPGPAGAVLPAVALRGSESRNFGISLPATAGPYRIKDIDPVRSVILERNPAWQGQPTSYDEIHLILIVDDKAAEIAYEAGEVDATRLAVSSLSYYRSKKLPDSTILEAPLHSFYWVGMRVDHPLFRDLRVRQAVQHAIDVDQLVNGAFFGAVEPATGIIAPGVIGHRPKTKSPDYNPDAARLLLMQAGFPNGFDTVITTTNETELIAAATIVATQLREVGINAEVAPEDKNSVWVRAQGPTKYRERDEMIVWQFGVNPDPYWYTIWFTSDQIGKWNWERWSNPEYDRLALEGARESDASRRQLIYERMADLLELSGAYKFFAHGKNVVIHKNHVNYKVRSNPAQPAFRVM